MTTAPTEAVQRRSATCASRGPKGEVRKSMNSIYDVVDGLVVFCPSLETLHTFNCHQSSACQNWRNSRGHHATLWLSDGLWDGQLQTHSEKETGSYPFSVCTYNMSIHHETHRKWQNENQNWLNGIRKRQRGRKSWDWPENDWDRARFAPQPQQYPQWPRSGTRPWSDQIRALFISLLWKSKARLKDQTRQQRRLWRSV